MKNSIIIILILLSKLTTFAQTEDCKYEKNEVDKFTNKKIILTKWEHLSPLISREFAPDVRCKVEDSVKQLQVYINGYFFTYDKPTQTSVDSFLVIPPGSKAIFLMEDGKPFEITTPKELHSFGDFTPARTGDNTSDKFRLNWRITMMYNLDVNDIKKLSAQGVTNLRVYFKPEKYTDYVIGKKKYATLQNLMNCIK